MTFESFIREAARLPFRAVMSLFWRLKNWSAVGEGHCFTSGLIHPSSRWVQAHFSHLNRGYRAEEEEFKPTIQTVIKDTAVTYDGLVSALDQVRYCEENKVPGAFVELGTWKGGCLAAMAMANLRYGQERRAVHGFDSFEGMPERNPVKDTDDSSLNLTPGSLAASEADVRDVFARTAYPMDHVHLYKGWFQDTVPSAAKSIGPIAILRLDGDFYDSYMVGLENLWDLVVPGGFVIFDDWVFDGCRSAVTEFFARRSIKSYICHADATVHFMQKH
jgi:hypothetical protein